MAYLSGPDWTLETPKIYVVLGCQRSGTSFLANCLRQKGVYFGTSGWRCESKAFYSVNKSIIQAAGGDWRNIPPEGALLSHGLLHGPIIKDTIKQFGARAPLWGCKDPRMALTARSWLDFLDGDVYLISIFRKPEKVAESLARLEQIPGGLDAGIEHAKEYDRRIISAIKEFVGV